MCAAPPVARCRHRTHTFTRGRWAFGQDRLFFTVRRPPHGPVTLFGDGLHVDLAENKSLDERAILIATEPLTSDELWHPIHGLRVFSRGRRVQGDA